MVPLASAIFSGFLDNLVARPTIDQIHVLWKTPVREAKIKPILSMVMKRRCNELV